MTKVQQELQEIIGENVRDLRQERNLSFRELAKRASLDPSAIFRIEKGQANVTLSTLVVLAGAFGVPVYTLLVQAAK